MQCTSNLEFYIDTYNLYLHQPGEGAARRGPCVSGVKSEGFGAAAKDSDSSRAGMQQSFTDRTKCFICGCLHYPSHAHCS